MLGSPPLGSPPIGLPVRIAQSKALRLDIFGATNQPGEVRTPPPTGGKAAPLPSLPSCSNLIQRRLSMPALAFRWLSDLSLMWITSGMPTIRPEPRAGTSAGRAFTGKMDCSATGYDGFRAAFQWEMKCGADEAKLGKVRRGL